jgi:uncharacterized protein YdeI (YjbR/CyaY-like superfamily)
MWMRQATTHQRSQFYMRAKIREVERGFACGRRVNVQNSEGASVPEDLTIVQVAMGEHQRVAIVL